MYYPVSLFIGWRYLQGRSGDKFSRFVSYLSTLGITIGVMALVTVLSVMNGFEDQLKSRMLGILPQAVLSQVHDRTELTVQIPDFIQRLSPGSQAKPLVRSEAVVQSAAQLSVGLLLGVSSLTDAQLSSFLIAGDLNSLTAGQYHVVIGQSLARQLQVKVGDKLRLMVTQASQFTPLGRLPSQRNFVVSGLFSTGSDVDGQLIFIHQEDARKLLRLPENTISGWRLFLDDPFDVAPLAQQPLPTGWYWSDWRQERGELFQAVRMEKNMMGLMLGLIVAIAAFNIISALIMVVMEKQSEVAILKTQGMNSSQIMLIFIVQGATSGVLGALSGGLLGIGLALYLNSLLSILGLLPFETGGLPVVLHLGQIMWVVVSAIILSILATLFPAYRAALVQPAEALRYE